MNIGMPRRRVRTLQGSRGGPALPLSILVAGALLSLTAGCSSEEPPTTADGGDYSAFTPAAPMSPEHEAAIADNQVTREEYEAGFRRFATCMDGAGGDLRSSDMNDDEISYSYTTVKIHDRCYDAEYREIDAMWQLDNIDYAPTIAAFSTCLEAVSATPELDESLKPYDQMISLARQLVLNDLTEAGCQAAAGLE